MTYESEDVKNYHTFPFDISLDSSPQTLTIDNPEFFTHNKILNSISVETEERNIKIKTNVFLNEIKLAKVILFHKKILAIYFFAMQMLSHDSIE